MHTHKQMETGRKCFFLMMLVLYIVVDYQGNIFHQHHSAGSRWPELLDSGKGESLGDSDHTCTAGFQTWACPSCAATGTMRSTCQNLFKPIHMARIPYVTAPWHAGVQQQRLGCRPEKIFKEIVHPKIKMISLFTHPHVVTNQYHFLCYAYNTKWDFEENRRKKHHKTC